MSSLLKQFKFSLFGSKYISFCISSDPFTFSNHILKITFLGEFPLSRKWCWAAKISSLPVGMLILKHKKLIKSWNV